MAEAGDRARSAARVATGAVVAAGAVAGLSCALVAPGRMDDERRGRWSALARHRYAHRGLYDRTLGIPENSLAAFRRARELGFASELDVHLTVDGKLVVMHDSDTRRMCGREGLLEDLTAAELADFRLDGTGEGIPAFVDVLDAYATHAGEAPAPPLLVELKTLGSRPVAPLCEATMAALDAAPVWYCVESFDPRAVAWLRRHRPEVIRGQLSQDFVANPVPELAAPLGLGATLLLGDVAARPDFVAYRFEDRHHPAVRLATGAFHGGLALWTLRSAEDLAQTEREGALPIFERLVPASPLVGGPI